MCHQSEYAFSIPFGRGEKEKHVASKKMASRRAVPARGTRGRAAAGVNKLGAVPRDARRVSITSDARPYANYARLCIFYDASLVACDANQNRTYADRIVAVSKNSLRPFIREKVSLSCRTVKKNTLTGWSHLRCAVGHTRAPRPIGIYHCHPRQEQIRDAIGRTLVCRLRSLGGAVIVTKDMA
ncbi:hypothetical protein EVAR_37290_1 [Eumeta japonica]|uniref:Uncharacterized protein n=1 Tax=Eumeta variegata TaxID=151549 RepID=A0A4C1WMV5_EUMVA|nr:hypothetical protein EVAR_37290_1 [Eumeta japonica]